jgi:hypothetical protein
MMGKATFIQKMFVFGGMDTVAQDSFSDTLYKKVNGSPAIHLQPPISQDRLL